MGVDTNIFLQERDANEIAKFIKEIHFVNKESVDILPAKRNNDVDSIYSIVFDTYIPGENRTLFVLVSMDNRLTYLSLGHWGASELIARELVNRFGGYADYDDCDDIAIDYTSTGRS
jgi:hypothetical protein